MSTRAIIEITDSECTHRIYCHSDGYPERLGAMIKEFVELAPSIDPNFPGNKAYWWDESYDPYKFVPNVAIQADKFAAALLGHLWKNQYTSAYLTDRDPEKEVAEGWTDIEYLYKVVLQGWPKYRLARQKGQTPKGPRLICYTCASKKFVPYSLSLNGSHNKAKL